MNIKACIVTTLKGALPSVVKTFVEYHLSIGFQHIYLFYDEWNEISEQSIFYSKVTTIGKDIDLKRLWKQTKSFNEYKFYVEKEVMARQILNVEVATRLALKSGYDWILHIDIDELFVMEKDTTASLHFEKLEDRKIHAINYFNHECIPEKVWIENYFEEVTLFKKNIQTLNRTQRENLWKINSSSYRNYFKFYKNGKSAAKLQSNLVPLSVHRFKGANSYCSAEEAFVLHYPCCGLNHFSSKYNILGNFSDKWFERDDIIKKLPVHLLSRNVALSNDSKLIERFYRIIFLEQNLNQTERLIEHGVYFRKEPLKKIKK